MILRIDTTNSVPVYAQIVDQIRRAIASGVLRGGESLPSLRETAVKLRVNPLTVGKAYKLLEQDGLVETRHGLGSFVTANSQASSSTYRSETLAREIDDLLVDAYQLGVSFDQVRRMVEERIEQASNGFAREKFERSKTDEQ